MDESNPKPLVKPTPGGTPPKPPVDIAATAAPASPASRVDDHWLARGSGHISDATVPPARPEHSVMEGLPEAKAERIASVYRELAETQRQLSAAQQRIATELQGRAEDADRAEALEARLQVQELEAKQSATRAAELENDIAGLRAQLASATTTAEELRREIATRDTQLEEARRQHREVTEKLEAESASLRETKILLETRDAELATRTTELATRTTERDTEQATKSRLERELEDERKQHRESIATRDTAIAAMTSERDAVKAELETVRRELDIGRTKARDIMNQLARLGQELDGAVAVATPSTERPQRSQPPPVPSSRAAAHTDVKPVEAILEMSEDPKPTRSRMRSVLLMLGGAVLGCAVTIAIAKASTSGTPTAGPDDLGATPSAAAAPIEAQPAAAPLMREASPDPATPSVEPTAEPTTVESARPNDETTRNPSEPAPTTTNGVILLPEAAEGHRVFVDGRKVEVKGSRAVVPCGTRAIQIGSRGTARTIDVACGGETTVPPDARDR